MITPMKRYIALINAPRACVIFIFYFFYFFSRLIFISRATNVRFLEGGLAHKLWMRGWDDAKASG